jgi:hypothetical protein
MRKINKSSFIYSMSEDQFRQIVRTSSSISEIGTKIGFKHKPGKYSKIQIKKRITELGMEIPIGKTVPKNPYVPKKRKAYSCSSCKVKMRRETASSMCHDCYWNAKREEKISRWLKTGDIGMEVQTTVRGAIRDFIYNEQESKCAICSMPRSWNGKVINFVLDHIDGNAANGKRSNLRLICPNCNSQLDTFTSKNKNSARTYRR